MYITGAPAWFQDSIKDAINDAIRDSIKENLKAALIDVLGLHRGQTTNLERIISNALEPIKADVRKMKDDLATVKRQSAMVSFLILVLSFNITHFVGQVYNHTFAIFRTDSFAIVPFPDGKDPTEEPVCIDYTFSLQIDLLFFRIHFRLLLPFKLLKTFLITT